jgi:hypothetical protein
MHATARFIAVWTCFTADQTINRVTTAKASAISRQLSSTFFPHFGLIKA